MLSPTERKLPDIIELFPGFEDRSYFQNPETGEFWFHATNVCKVLGFSNPTSALSLHCDDDEKLMEICNGKATWFVSEAGCYGLAMGAKNDVAKAFKRWLKHKVLPKLRSQGLVTARMHDESLADYEARDKFLTSKISKLETTQNELIDTSYQLMVAIIEINSVISEWSIDLVPSIRHGIKTKADVSYLRTLMQQLTSGLNRLLQVDDWVQAIDSVMLSLPDDLDAEDYELKKQVFDDFILQLTKSRLKTCSSLIQN